MVSTRHRTYFESPKPALHQPAAQQPAPRKPVQRRPVQRRPVQRRPAQQNPAQGAKTKKVGKKAKPTIEEDEEALDEEQDAVEQDDDVEEEAVDNDAAPNPKSGRKRPTTDVNEGSSRKVRKTRAAGPSNRNATGSGPPSGDAAGVEQAPVPKKVKDKGKGKETEEEAAAAAAASDANVSALFCSIVPIVPLMATHVLMVTSLGLNQQTVHKTISKIRNPQKSLQKPGQQL